MKKKIDELRELTVAKSRLELIEYEIWSMQSVGTISSKAINHINDLATNARITIDDLIINLKREKEQKNAKR